MQSLDYGYGRQRASERHLLTCFFYFSVSFIFRHAMTLAVITGNDTDNTNTRTLYV